MQCESEPISNHLQSTKNQNGIFPLIFPIRKTFYSTDRTVPEIWRITVKLSWVLVGQIFKSKLALKAYSEGYELALGVHMDYSWPRAPKNMWQYPEEPLALGWEGKYSGSRNISNPQHDHQLNLELFWKAPFISEKNSLARPTVWGQRNCLWARFHINFVWFSCT